MLSTEILLINTACGGQKSDKDYLSQIDTVIVDVPKAIKATSMKDGSVIEPIRVAKSKPFYENLLNDFCKKHFHKRWHRENYKPNSIRVNNYSSFDTNTDEISGTFSFEGKTGKDYNNREFRALVLDDGDGNYHITLFRKKELFLGLKQGDEVAIRNKPFFC